jgi:peptidoglycan/xylan/chitin deacetylase (PgdA/CDA1 family)
VGFWRLLRLFQERKLPLTLFACALALERNPATAAAIRESGFDICSHGWRWVKHFELSEAEEREHIARAVTSIERTIGRKPEGWYCRYGPSVNTRRLVVEHGGFLYDADSYADELPYWQLVAGHQHLVVPYTLDANDMRFGSAQGFNAGDQFFNYLRDSFDVLYAEGEDRPRMLSIGLHCRLVGRPGRFRALQRFLDHVEAHDRVWVCRRADIARHWHDRHPPLGR